MTEGLSKTNADKVWWINRHEPPGRSERVRIWLFELAKRGTYIHKEEIPFSTSIEVSEIEELADPRLRDALIRQQSNIMNNDAFLTIPVATIHSKELSHIYSVSRHPIERS